MLENSNYNKEYSNNLKNDTFKINPFNILAVICYSFVIYSTLIHKFIPINNLSWFNLGMGKLVGIGAIFAIFFVLINDYFIPFFISIFSGFFSIHELIIFYDNYAIEAGKELGEDGVFRSLFDIFNNAFNFHFGFFWAIIGSSLSFIAVTIAWILHTYYTNRKKS